MLSVALVACGDTDGSVDDGAYSDHAESSDFDLVMDIDAKGDAVAPVFDHNNLFSETFFTAHDVVAATAIQDFLETSPYGHRNWLADELVDGVPASRLIADAAARHGINPINLLARMQVEKGLISRSTRPSSSTINGALGCGCADGQSCSNNAFRGLKAQLDCAAETLEKHHLGALNGDSGWRVGVSRRTLDGVAVKPANQATASLYSYTPWVLRGRGGNWLVWNVTRKFTRHFEARGLIDLPTDGWIGETCGPDHNVTCSFAHDGETGFCLDFPSSFAGVGYCSLICNGLCPDRAGHAWTFCTESTVAPGVGVCVPQARPENNNCLDVAETEPVEVDRFVGTSGATARRATVCLPLGGF